MTRVCRLVDPSVMMVGGGDGTNHVDTQGTPRAELSVSLSLPASTVARFPSLEHTGFPWFWFFSFFLPPPGFFGRLLFAPSWVSVVPFLSPSVLPSFFFLAHSCVLGGLVFVCWLREPN